MLEVRVGTCGFAASHHRTFVDFDLVEVQASFYQPPRVATAVRWRAEAPADFEFTLKAWQLITHRATSPTYRRLREPLSESERDLAGDFRWNGLTRAAWERTQQVADALEARAIVLQTPISFRPGHENLSRLRRFFESVDRRGRILVFEPRGADWNDSLLTALAEGLDLVIGVDPFLRPPLGAGLRYLRLHGRPAYHYRYRYSDEDLERLALTITVPTPHWVLFNNFSMADDARRFIQRLKEPKG